MVQFFETQADFRAWLEQHHDTERELWLGFYKKVSGRGGMAYKEAVDQALCFGWIDGVRMSIDTVSYRNRFTPRTKTSIWSAVNIKRVAELTAMGLMHPAGLKVFEARDVRQQNKYSFEVEPMALDAESEALFQANAAAWTFFLAQAPSYQRSARHWVMTAKQDKTKASRLARLMEDSANAKRLDQFVSPNRRKQDAP